MYLSLKAKTFLLIFVTMVATAVTVVYFSDRDITQAIMASEEASARNVIQLIDLNVKQSYSQLLDSRVTSLQQHKATLLDLSTIAGSVLTRYEQLFLDKRLTRAQAQADALDWLRSTRQTQDYRWFIMDRSAEILAHSDHSLEGTSIAAMTDVKGRALISLLNDSKRSNLVDYAVFYRNAEDLANARGKLGYLKTLPQWGWILVTVVDIKELEEEATASKASALESLKDSFAKIRIARTGTAFMFDGSGEVLIPPSGPLKPDFLTTTNASTGNSVFTDLMALSKHNTANLTCTLPQVRGEETPYKIYHSYFKPFDWHVAVAIPIAEIALPAKQVTARQKQVITLIFLASLIIAYIFVSRISRPLKELTGFANQLPQHDFTSAMETSPEISTLATGRRDEVGRLAESFVFMVHELENNIGQLMEATATRERMAEELNIARKIQMGILPKTFPAFPNRTEFDLFALLHPAKEVGGDLYDFFLIDDQRLCFTLGDVSDKGIPAALFMMITQTLIKTTAQHFDSTAEIMEQVNAMLSNDNPNTMFVTLIIGILDLHSGEVRYANGGHNPPVYIKQGREFTFLNNISGPIVGAMEGLEYQELSLTLEVGDTLFLYTDGVTEAMDETRRQFGNDKLLTCLGEDSATGPETVIHHVMSCIKSHVGQAPQSDDIAMLALRYLGTTDKDTETVS